MIDFHTHILPGIDDGSKSVEQSIAMLEMEAQQGIRKVVATPHFYAHSDKPEKFLKKRNEAESLLRQEMARHSDLPELEIGAEVYYYNGISDSDILPELTIGQKRYILIEMPSPPWPERVYKELENIWIKQSLVPIVAHIDRYIAPLRTFGIPKRLELLPVLVQANTEFFLEKATKRMALRMLKQGRIHLLGSDCHSTEKRKPNMGEALRLLQRQFGPEILEYLRRNEMEIFSECE